MSDTPTATERASPFAWDVEISDVPASSPEIRRVATAAERLALASALEILSCESCTATYRVRRLAGDRYGLRGSLNAEIVQACVITLAPVHDMVATTFNVEFWPAEQLAAEGGAVDLEDETDIEPIDGHRLTIGRVIYEELAAALNPYPRRPGAEFTPATDLAGMKPSPFAALATLKAANKNSEP
jgi:uncharacterized metal-binding protein YceD (DUF177 family)